MIMGIEQIINQKLNKYPGIKKTIKRIYQTVMYSISPKIISEGNIIRISPDDDFEYFFGYYDKSPWDKTDRFMLCLKVKETWKDVAPSAVAKIVIIDTLTHKITEISETRAWNVQQGCMLQWFANSANQIIFNDFRDGAYCSVLLELSLGSDNVKVVSERVFDLPVYSIAGDASFALSLDFSRLHQMAPGYGYSNVIDSTQTERLPKRAAIWKLDFSTGQITEFLTYSDFACFEPRHDMTNAFHKVNHIMISPNNNRFMVLHRWFQGEQKYTRLVTCNIDGSDMYNLSDDDMVSHCFWKDNDHILAFETKKGAGSGYYLMKDRSSQYERYWKEIDFDGHPSYSPTGNKVVFDSYPNKRRVASIFVSEADNKETSNLDCVARVFAPFRYDNEFRCDLHPRWNRAGDTICFDSVFEGKRGLYVVRVI